jgi:hypothetical protein
MKIDLRLQIAEIRALLRSGLVIEAYDKLGDLDRLNYELLKEVKNEKS